VYPATTFVWQYRISIKHPTQKPKARAKNRSSLPRITTDFSSHFHIRKNRKNRAAPAWILDFRNPLHQSLASLLWTSRQVVDFTIDTNCKNLFDLKHQ